MSTTFWFKSSYSHENGDACVDIALLPESIGIRDSKSPAIRPLTVSVLAWRAFVAGLRNG